MANLRLRKLAEADENGNKVFAGLKIETELAPGVTGPPDKATMSMGLAQQGEAEGWLTLENLRPVHRPGGPAAQPWRITHTFLHADALVLHTVDGDVRYRVVRQPDKYVAGDDLGSVTPDIYEAGDTVVSWAYGLELEA